MKRFLIIMVAGLFLGGLLLLSLTADVAPALADTLYDNGPPNAANGNEMTFWIQAEEFILASDSVLTDIRFWAFGFREPGSYQGSIVWSIYANTPGGPGALLHRATVVPTRTFRAPTPFGGGSFQHDFSVGEIPLGAGTYWLGLHNGPLTRTVRDDYYWETTVPNATRRGHEDVNPFDVGGWFNNGQEHAFILFGRGAGPSAPEPSSVVLLGSSLIALGFLRRRLGWAHA